MLQLGLVPFRLKRLYLPKISDNLAIKVSGYLCSVSRLLVLLSINSNSLNIELSARSENSNRDLSSICYQDLFNFSKLLLL